MQTTPISRWQRQLLRFGPQMGQRSAAAIARGAVGAGLSIFICTVALQILPGARETGLYLVSGFGAMSVLLFVLPNSPLAQPYSVLVGMVVSPLTAMIVLRFVPPPYADGLAVAGAIAAMLALRALHPPAAGLALLVVLQYETNAPLGFGFILMPIAIVTVVMVCLAMAWNKLFNIPYPAPAVEPPTPTNTTAAPETAPSLSLTETDIADLLLELRLSSNLVTADVAGLVQAATGRAQHILLTRTPVSHIMTANPETITPDTTISAMARDMADHHIKSLPVVDANGRFLGLVAQRDVLRSLADETTRPRPGVLRLHPKYAEPTAAALLNTATPPVTPDTPVAAVLDRLRLPDAHAIPVLGEGQLVGMISRTDLSALLMSQLPTTPPSQLL